MIRVHSKPAENVIYSEPSVTLRAKDFLESPARSHEYKEAADAVVYDVVFAIEERIKKSSKQLDIAATSKKKPHKKSWFYFFSRD